MIYQADTIHQIISRVDTIYINSVDPEITQTYLKILSDTNSQLNSSYTPLVVSITILTALIGLGAIAAGYFIWRQGKDFKERQNEILAEFSNSKDQYSRFVDSMKSLESRYTTSLNTLVHKLKNEGTVSQELEEKLKKSIKNTSDKIKKDIQINTLSRNRLYDLRCRECDEYFNVVVEEKKGVVGRKMTDIVTKCPHCGKMQSYKV